VNNLLTLLKKTLKGNWQKLALTFLSLAVFVSLWSLYAAWLHGDWPFEGGLIALTVPYPREVLAAFVDSFQNADVNGITMWGHIYASLKRVLAGFLLALAVALPAGLLMGRSSTSHWLGRPIVESFRPIPPLAWIPIFIVVFGLFWGPVGIVFLGIFFPILYNVMFGSRSVDPILIDAARTLGAKKSDLFLKVVLPFTLPYLMTGITVGLGIGWMCIVAAEMLGGVGGGVGYYIADRAGSQDYEYMYAGMVVIAILGTLTTGVAGLLENRIYKWMGMK